MTSPTPDNANNDEDWEVVTPPSPASSSSPSSLLPAPPTQKTPTPTPHTAFPTTLADLQRNTDPAAHSNIYTSLKSLRRSTLSIHNRLASIVSDSEFVERVANHYVGFPVVANERCGGWYIPMHLRPDTSSGHAEVSGNVSGNVSAYFKSTDGHHGQWAFSTRRLNLGLLALLGEKGGAVLVDSTRRGKRVSDALAKTVPVWVGVVNRCLFPELKWGEEVGVWEGVGESEKRQIGERLGRWCEEFRGLGLDLEGLRQVVRRPVVVRWVVNGVWEGGEKVSEEGSNTLVLCSASRMVEGAEASEGGYVQGSGDDHEGWSRGLTPDVFWKNQEFLMATGEEELPELITKLMSEKECQETETDAVCIQAVGTIWIGKGYRKSDEGWDLIINCQGKSELGSARIMDLYCRQMKLGSKDLREYLPAIRSFTATTFERKPDCRILITCDTGKDLSVGAAVALLCLHYGDNGKPWVFLQGLTVIDKHVVKKRLAWISSSKPDANPSRATLQAVNSFLMDRPG